MQAAGNQIKFAIYGTRICAYKTKSVALSGSGDQSVIAAVTGKRIAIVAFVLAGASTSSIYFTDGTTTTGTIPVNATNPSVVPYGGGPWFHGAAGAAISINASVNINGQIIYVETD